MESVSLLLIDWLFCPTPPKEPFRVIIEFVGVESSTKLALYGLQFSSINVTSSPIDDEAHFWLNGYANKQNCRIWSEANPQVYVETPLHPDKLTVWCALWAGGILLQKRRRPQRYSQW
ncbi:uncharacterized protein TNCV_4883181 [Trichonephila clavipes]|nr:uncharacterized protein TNCV_4883181 [Trichonephila clavipes]